MVHVFRFRTNNRMAMNLPAIAYLPRPGSTEGLVKGVSRAPRGRSQTTHAKTLDEPEASRRIVHAMARSESVTRGGTRVLVDYLSAFESRRAWWRKRR